MIGRTEVWVYIIKKHVKRIEEHYELGDRLNLTNELVVLIHITGVLYTVCKRIKSRWGIIRVRILLTLLTAVAVSIVYVCGQVTYDRYAPGRAVVQDLVNNDGMTVVSEPGYGTDHYVMSEYGYYFRLEVGSVGDVQLVKLYGITSRGY